ncbi:MAG TPA: hypothetical protein VEX86_21335 [Longimicrobium sp.]|nr:hypothetical protein [Longimicrobium sp.]
MRRISARSPLSENPREFVLATLLMTMGAVLFAGFGVTTLASGAYDEGNLKGWQLAYAVIGWGKYLAGARLLYLGDRATLRHEFTGWKRTALLWLPLALFIFYSYLQWVVLGDARTAYLQRTGRWDGTLEGGTAYMAVIYPIAFAITALNALWIQRKQVRIAF